MQVHTKSAATLQFSQGVSLCRCKNKLINLEKTEKEYNSRPIRAERNDKTKRGGSKEGATMRNGEKTSNKANVPAIELI